MANFITPTLSYEGQQTRDYVFAPMFEHLSPADTMGIRVMANIVSKRKLNYVGRASKISKAYQQGFNGATGAAIEMLAECGKHPLVMPLSLVMALCSATHINHLLSY